MSKTRIISRKEAEQLLTMEACIAAMEQTLQEVSAGATSMLQRSMMPQQKGNKFALITAHKQQQGLCGVKAIVLAGPEAKKADRRAGGYCGGRVHHSSAHGGHQRRRHKSAG